VFAFACDGVSMSNGEKKQANDPASFAVKQIIAFQTDDKMREAIMAFMAIVYSSGDITFFFSSQQGTMSALLVLA